MSPKRPPSIMGDEERAAIGAEHRKTPPAGIPVEVDPETTPPPAEPPDITQLEGFESLAPEIKAPLLALHNAQRELDVGMMRVWEGRNTPHSIGQLQIAVEVLTERVAPLVDLGVALRAQGQQLHRVVVWMEAQAKRDDRLDKLLDSLDKRLDGIEREHAGLNATIVALGQRIDGGFGSAARGLETVNARVDSLDARLRHVESTMMTEASAAELANHMDTRHDKLEARIASLEETRTRARGAMWVLGLLITAAATVGGFLLHEVWTWIRGAK